MLIEYLEEGKTITGEYYSYCKPPTKQGAKIVEDRPNLQKYKNFPSGRCAYPQMRFGEIGKIEGFLLGNIFNWK